MSSEPETFQEIWDQAFKTYQDQTERKLQSDERLIKLRSSKDLLNEIESSQKAFGSFRNRHGKLWSVLGSCLAPIDLLGHTLQDSLSSAPFAPAVFASVFHLVNVSDQIYIEELIHITLFIRHVAQFPMLMIIWRVCLLS